MPATTIPTFAPRVRGPEWPAWNVDRAVELLTIVIAFVEKTEPERVRVWPLNGFWEQPAWRTVKTVILCQIRTFFAWKFKESVRER